MKTSKRNLVLLAALSPAHAFVTSPVHPHLPRAVSTTKSIASFKANASTSLKMSDFDFPSAMPEKPVQTMEEQLKDSATSFIADINARLGEGVDPPPELEALKKVRDDEGSTVQELSLKIYELMIGEFPCVAVMIIFIRTGSLIQ